MAERNKDWQIGPNLKPDKGSQGTLFRGNVGIGDARYPRGYTPERLHDVANAVGGSYTIQKGVQAGPHANYFRDHAVGLFQDGQFQITGRADHAPTRRLVDNIARSTVPLEHLNPVAPAKSLSFWSHPSSDQDLERVQAAGQYNPDPAGHMGSRNDINIHTKATAGTTPIHEIGHHVSNLLGNDHSASAARTPGQRGQEEGFADAYAHEHFRDRRGKQVSSLRDYPAETYYPTDVNRQDAFAAGYSQARAHIPTPTPSWHTDAPKSIQNDSPTFNSMQRTGQTGLFSISVSGGPREEKFEGFRDADWHLEDKEKK